MVSVLISLLICYLPYFVVGFIRPYKRYIKGEDYKESIDVLLLGSYVLCLPQLLSECIDFCWGNKGLQRFVLVINTYFMKQPDLYYFETIKMTSQAWSNFVWRIRATGEYSL